MPVSLGDLPTEWDDVPTTQKLDLVDHLVSQSIDSSSPKIRKYVIDIRKKKDPIPLEQNFVRLYECNQAWAPITVVLLTLCVVIVIGGIVYYFWSSRQPQGKTTANQEKTKEHHTETTDTTTTPATAVDVKAL